MWSYKIVFVLVLATVKVNVSAKYMVSNDSLPWGEADCILGEPTLAYNNISFYVNESLELQSNDTDVWIGYRHAKIPFLFLGCGIVDTWKTYEVTSIGYCFNACGGETFGIQARFAEDILSDLTEKTCLCVRTFNITISEDCLDNGNSHLCKHNDANPKRTCASVFTQVNATGGNEVFPNVSNSVGDCMLYYYDKFVWRECNLSRPILVMCSNSSHTDLYAKATVPGDKRAGIWADGNKICLKKKMHPAFAGSIRNGGFSDFNTQYYWTGIIRSAAIITSSAFADTTTYPTEPFAYLTNFTNGNTVLRFSSNATRKALCVKYQETSSTVTTTQSSTTAVYSTGQSTIVISSAHSTDEFPVVVGIGLAVGIIIVVGAIVAIRVLRKRGLLPCKLGKKAEKTDNDGKLASRSYEETVGDHNYFILEKCAQSVGVTDDHYNAADESNADNGETDNYNSINDLDDQRVKDDYDYTTNAFRTAPNTRKPDNIYNKLMIDRPGDYDHVGIPGHNILKAGNDYDTTDVARRNDGDGDYNHIPHPDSTNCVQTNGSKELAQVDYDVINGKQIELSQSDAADYAHVNV